MPKKTIGYLDGAVDGKVLALARIDKNWEDKNSTWAKIGKLKE